MTQNNTANYLELMGSRQFNSWLREQKIRPMALGLKSEEIRRTITIGS